MLKMPHRMDIIVVDAFQERVDAAPFANFAAAGSAGGCRASAACGRPRSRQRVYDTAMQCGDCPPAVTLLPSTPKVL